MSRRFWLVFLASLAVAAPARAQSESPPPQATATEADFAGVVGRAVSDYIVPSYRALHEATAVLKGGIDDFCKAPSEEGRATVEAAFSGTLTAWAGVDFFRFGPMAVEGRYERFAFFPDVHGTGTRQMRQFLAGKDEKLLAPGALARQSAAVQGLPALESLLYAGDNALLNAAAPEAFRCALAAAVAANLAAIAAAANAGWSGEGSWGERLRTPGPGNPVYRTHKEAMTEILKGVLTGLEQDRDHRLVPALGATPEEARASRAPYNRSGLALPYLAASADALERFAQVSGLLGLIPEGARWVANSVGFEFANLEGALAAAGPDLEAALADGDRRQKLVYAAIVLKSLRDLFQNQVSAAAGISAGFNALDGD